MKYVSIVALFALTACASASGDTVQTDGQSARAEAAAKFPGVNVDAIAGCVRSNATDAELVLLSQGGDIATRTTQSIIAKPATAQCLRDNNVGLQEA